MASTYSPDDFSLSFEAEMLFMSKFGSSFSLKQWRTVVCKNPKQFQSLTQERYRVQSHIFRKVPSLHYWIVKWFRDNILHSHSNGLSTKSKHFEERYQEYLKTPHSEKKVDIQYTT